MRSASRWTMYCVEQMIVTKTLSFVFVSHATSRDWMRVDSAPLTASPAHGMSRWQPGSANFKNLPQRSTT